MATHTTNTTLKLVQRMRNQADILEDHADFLERYGYEEAERQFSDSVRDPDTGVAKLPEKYWEQLSYISVYTGVVLEFNVRGPRARALMTGLRRELGGTWQKSAVGDRFWMHSTIGDVRVRIEGDRDSVCVPRVIGTEKKVIPAVEAVEAQPERVEEVDVIEWDCGTILEGDGDE